MSSEIAVVGAGTIGSTAAYTLTTVCGFDVRLIDIDGELATGHASDIRHANAHVSHPVGADAPTGSIEAVAPGPDAITDVDCIVVAASIERPNTGGRRLTFLDGNREVIDDIAEWMGPCDPRPIVIVSNPVDRLTYRLWRRTEWPRRRLVGYSLSETARMAALVAEREGVRPKSVSVPVLGEHGDHMVAAFSRATIGGESYRPPTAVRERLLAATKQAPYDIIEQRGAEETSRWVSGRGVALLVRSIVTGGCDETVCLSTPLDGEYGESGVCMSVPLTLDSDGVETIHEWDLSDDERTELATAAERIRETLAL